MTNRQALTARDILNNLAGVGLICKPRLDTDEALEKIRKLILKDAPKDKNKGYFTCETNKQWRKHIKEVLQ